MMDYDTIDQFREWLITKFGNINLDLYRNSKQKWETRRKCEAGFNIIWHDVGRNLYNLWPFCRAFFIYIVNANKSDSKIHDDLEKVQAND